MVLNVHINFVSSVDHFKLNKKKPGIYLTIDINRNVSIEKIRECIETINSYTFHYDIDEIHFSFSDYVDPSNYIHTLINSMMLSGFSVSFHTDYLRFLGRER